MIELRKRTPVQHNLRAIYDRAFFAEQIEGASRSARILVPLIMKFVRGIGSVVDVGCGTGVWLASFKDAGVPRVLGLDGGAAAEHSQLEIEPEEFLAANLETNIDIDESFDLCLCLEVAEHLTERAATVIVRNICKLSDIVVFSAAIPGQGGSHHINERWPSYWAELFAAAGYEVLDSIRGRIWNDARVEWWYRQNLLIFANKAGVSRIVPSSVTAVLSTPLDIVHPACFEQYRQLSGQEERLLQKVSLLEQRNTELERALQEKDETLSQRVAVLEQRNADLERDLRERDETLSQQVALLEQRNADLERDSRERDEILSQQVALLERRNSDLERDLEAIMNSTSWKLTWPLRRVLSKHDNFRRNFRALARIGWLIVSGEFLKRLKTNRSE
jgi:SAM-dependent methyltransferase